MTCVGEVAKHADRTTICWIKVFVERVPASRCKQWDPPMPPNHTTARHGKAASTGGSKLRMSWTSTSARSTPEVARGHGEYVRGALNGLEDVERAPETEEAQLRRC
eukprot:6737233-Pyramimonas_sp.AAC.1